MLSPLSEKLQNLSEIAFFWQTRAAREAVEKFDTAWQELRYQNRKQQEEAAVSTFAVPLQILIICKNNGVSH